MINELLEKSKVKKKLIGIDLYADEGYWCGIILDFNEDTFQLQHFTKFGEKDGVTIDEISKIERIDFGDDYLKSIEFLIEHQEKLKENPHKNRFFEDLVGEDWQTLALTPYLNEKNFLISISISGDSTYRGFVEKIDDYSFFFKCIGELGENKGYSMFKFDDVFSIKINDLECRKRFLLHKNSFIKI